MLVRKSLAAATATALLCVGGIATDTAIGAQAALSGAPSLTNSGDNLRDGWYPDQPSLTPQLVSGGTFGQQWSAAVDGQVYAQPLYSNGAVLVATETNKVYALDAVTGANRWSTPVNLGTPWNPADVGCGDLTPSVGVTATPVIDPASNTAYLTHKTYGSGTTGPARWYLDALDMATGAQRAGFPVLLQGTAQNAPGQTFSPTTQLQRPGLLLLDGVVYAAFGAHCDGTPWQGWVFGVSTSGAVRARWVAVDSGNGAGIWQSGAGLMSDRSGSLFVATGNGQAPAVAAPGNAPPPKLGESIVRLSVQPDGSLVAADFFAPFDAPQLDTWDADFSAGGFTGLPDAQFGTTAVPHLGVVAGKSGYVYLLNRDALGGTRQGPNGADNVVQRVGPYGGVWARPGVWPGDGGYVYLPTASGGNSAGGFRGYLNVFKYGVSGSGQPALSLDATTQSANGFFGFSTSAPIITSDGTKSGSALVWFIWTADGSGAGAQLRAYDAVPVNGLPVLRWNAPIGTSAKFAMPGIGGGRVFVGTRDGHVLGFGAPVTTTLTGAATNFPVTTVGSSSSRTVTVTATGPVTVTGVSTSDPRFVAGTVQPALPATLAANQTISIPVTYSPTTATTTAATLTLQTNLGTSAFALTGIGQAAAAQIAVAPPLVSFGATAVGGQLSGSATFKNVGATALTINKINPPTAPFGATGLPTVGSTIAPGAAVTVTVSFGPTSTGDFSSSVGLETTGGIGTVGLTGTSAVAGVLQIVSAINDYGPVAVGTSATRNFTITNVGGTAVTILKSKPPTGGAFVATTALAEGTTIPAGGSVTESVVFTPTASGVFTGSWDINGNDTTGLHQVQFTGTGGGTGTIPAPGAGWTVNGRASITNGEITLTPASPAAAGSSFWSTPLDSNHLSITYDQTIGGGGNYGGDGMTLTLADATKATPASLGAVGGGLGFAGITGTAVAFDTFKNSVDPSDNFVGITNGPTAGSTDLLNWIATSTAIPPLRNATRKIAIVANNGTLTVSIDGTVALTKAVTLPPKVYLGFTAGTGGLTNLHKAANVVATTTSTTPPPTPTTTTTTPTTTTVPATTTTTVPTATIPAPGAGWTVNGRASITNGEITLTPASPAAAGSSFWSTPLDSNHLSITYDQTIGGGGNYGGDGMTLTLADATKATPASLGAVGGGLGFAGITGTAVAFDTFKNSVDPSDNFVGITNGPTAGSTDLLNWIATSTAIPPLRNATRKIAIVANNGTLTVSIDGTVALTKAVTLPPKVYLGFTAGTGGLTNLHKAANVVATTTTATATATAMPTIARPTTTTRTTTAGR